jgi:hypothetical protein
MSRRAETELDLLLINAAVDDRRLDNSCFEAHHFGGRLACEPAQIVARQLLERLLPLGDEVGRCGASGDEKASHGSEDDLESSDRNGTQKILRTNGSCPVHGRRAARNATAFRRSIGNDKRAR